MLFTEYSMVLDEMIFMRANSFRRPLEVENFCAQKIICFQGPNLPMALEMAGQKMSQF
jgi:hypothetical protein